MRRALLLLLCILLAAGGGWYLFHKAGSSAQNAGRRGAGQPVPVLVAESRTQDVPIYLDGLGTVQAFNSVTVRPMIDGPLVEVRFHEGQDVKAGEVLARIDPRPYQAALDQAQAKKSQDEASLANAKLDLARYAKLAQTNYTTQQQADTQKAVVAQDEALVRQDQAQVETAQTNLSYTTIAAPLDGRTGLRQVDQGNIVHTGDANGLVVITQLHPISVLFTLPQQNLAAVRAAMQAGGAEVLALPQGSLPDMGTAASGADAAGPGMTASAAAPGALAAADPPGDPAPPVLDRGTLAVLDNQVDPATGTIRLKATFPNPNLTLWPGGFVNVRLLVRTDPQVVTIPPAAVQRGPQGAYVYVVGPDDKASRRVVALGHEDERVAVVTDGLKTGETVVTDGASRLTEGAKVTISKPAAPGPGAKPATPPAAPGTASRAHHRRAS